MPRLTKAAVTGILTNSLSLREPIYQLRRAGDKWVGNIISETFKGKRDHERQDIIRNALEENLGEVLSREVGYLLVYTPEEWRLGADKATWNRDEKKQKSSTTKAAHTSVSV